MTIEKGQPWGEPGPLPDDGVVVRSDREARQVLEAASREGRPYPTLGLLGGDLCRTLAGPGDESRLRSGRAMRFPVDLGHVLVDERRHLFLSHLVARSAWWTRAVVAMNAQWLGSWNLGPRAHPNDGLLDTYDSRLTLADLPKIRIRLAAGTHLPHPRVRERRTPSAHFELQRPLSVWLDGTIADRGRVLAVGLQPDAVTVVI